MIGFFYLLSVSIMQLKWTSLYALVITGTAVSALVSFNHNQMVQLFIRPSSRVPCSSQPCLTLSQLVANTSWLKPNTELIFLPGNHVLNSKLSISNVSKFSMLCDSLVEGSQTVHCQNSASFNFDCIDGVSISDIGFVGCGSNKILSVKRFSIKNCSFQGANDSGTALEVNATNLTITHSSFFNYLVGTSLELYDSSSQRIITACVGGVLFVNRSNVTISVSNFANNNAQAGGVIYAHEFSTVDISGSLFIHNAATFSGKSNYSYYHYDSKGNKYVQNMDNFCMGGVIVTGHTKLTVNDSSFWNNTSECEGGVMSIQDKSIATIEGCEFFHNSVNGNGGALLIAMSNVSIEKSTFMDNSATQGGALQVSISSVLVTKSIYRNNQALLNGGAVASDQSSHFSDDHSVYINNRAKANGGVLYIVRSEVTLNYTEYSTNRATGLGGALYLLQCERVMFYGFIKLTSNVANTGGGLYTIESTLIVFNANLSITCNFASDKGGGLYLYSSRFVSSSISITNISHNTATVSGGGVQAVNSLVICNEFSSQTGVWPFQTLLIFFNNTAHNGGGMCLESSAQLRIQIVNDNLNIDHLILNTSVFFVSNSAVLGSAIYVVDDSYFNICARGSTDTLVKNNTSASTAECFIQVFSQATQPKLLSEVANIKFLPINSSEPILFGGLLDRCLPDPRSETFADGYEHNEFDGVNYLKLISNLNDTRRINSLPVRICFCRGDLQPDCSYDWPTVHVKKGQKISVSLVAVDQVNHTIENVLIYSSLSHPDSTLGEGQATQSTGNACSRLTFSIYSPHSFEQLILYPEGPCRNVSRSQSRVRVVLLPCECPIGFQTDSLRNNCVCVCDSRLSPYITQYDHDCNDSAGTLRRRSNFWITFINDTRSTNNLSVGGFLIYPHCPFGYCLPPNPNIVINLNMFNGSDMQCSNNRSGTLCGACQSGLSLSHGSSRCIPCSQTWYYEGLLTVIITTFFVGVTLVALLMCLNLTVAVGSLNGLIFYANILGAIKSTFFSGLSPSTRFLSIFISWLNLEIGFDICVIKGIDTYWKTWLQLGSPVYIILLVIVIIFISSRSMKFSRLLSKRNPVATLATLILLSYTMFLQKIITSLAFATLVYPDQSSKVVWLSDATVGYLSGKHTALFIAAILILTICIVYTFLLTFWQCLIHHQEKAIFRWTKSQTLHHFIEPYHAPYKVKHRYWTGLLLFTRIALYLAFALNVSGDPGFNLLVVILAVMGLILIKACFGQIYRNRFIDSMEMICYANVGVFSAIKYKTTSKLLMDITAIVSGVIAFILLIVAICLQAYTVLLSDCLSRCKQRKRRNQLIGESTCNSTDIIVSESSELLEEKQPTFSVVELGLPHSDYTSCVGEK